MIIDAIFCICLLIFLVKGYSKGVVVALFSVLAIILGTVGALKLSGIIANLLFDHGEKGGRWVPFVSYLIAFILIILLVKLGAKLIQRAMEAVALGWVNRLAGAVLYMFLVCFVFSAVLWLFNKMAVLNPETKSDSIVYAFIEPLAPKVFCIDRHCTPICEKHFRRPLPIF